MADRKWTLVVMPHGSGASRVIQLSQTALKVGATLCAVLFLVAAILGFTTVSRGVDLRRATVVEQENAVLADQLAQLQGRLVLLEDTLSAIAERDSRIRLIADLQPHDPQVLQAGVGGSLPPSAPGGVLTRQALS